MGSYDPFPSEWIHINQIRNWIIKILLWINYRYLAEYGINNASMKQRHLIVYER